MTEVDPRIGSEIAGYRIESLLGRCGLGVVYLAGDVCGNRRVALRLLSPDLTADVRFRERFLRESQVAASLDHPNIVPVYEAGEAEGCLYVATGYVDAVDLVSLLAHEGRLAPERALSIVAQLADALDAARWSRGLVHGSLTPSEVLVAATADAASGQHVSLLGFGLRQELPPGATLAEASRRLGTVDCLAPEQIEGKPVSPRTDVYALGCVLFQCLTGRPPFKRDSDDAVLDAHRYEPPPSVTRYCPGLPAGIDRVIGKAMAKWPEERYSACGELAAAAQAALSHGREQPVPASRGERISEVVPLPAPAEATDGGAVVEPDASASRPGTRGWRTIAAISVVVLLAALAAGAVWLTGRDPGDPSSTKAAAAGVGTTGEVVIAGGQTGSGQPAETEAAAETAGDGSLARIVSLGPGRLVRIDAATGAILARVAIPPPGPVATDGRSIWVLSGPDTTNRAFLVHVAAATNDVTEIFDATPIVGRSGPSTLAATGGSAWVSSYESRQVYRFDPGASVAEQVEFDADSPAFASPVAAAGSLWGSAPSGLLQVDPETERVLARIDGVGPVAAAGEGFLWAYVNGPHRIVRVDTQTHEAVPVPAVKRSWDEFTVADGAVWAASPGGGVIVRLDPVTGEEQGRIRVWRAPGPLAAVVDSTQIAAGTAPSGPRTSSTVRSRATTSRPVG